MTTHSLPKLITFDGEARSGKGTIVSGVKDYLRDECGYKVMLIDRGQTFRVLVVAASRAGIDLDDPKALDDFLSNETNVTECVRFVKSVYHMSKEERDGLLYTNQVGADSAKVGAHPSSQIFVANLTKKWLRDAGSEGYEVVLVDGRALEKIGAEMHQEGLCDYRLGLYFVCDAIVGARRTLGYATTAYEDLTPEQQADVDELIEQIMVRNQRDKDRAVERLVSPQGAPTYALPQVPVRLEGQGRPMVVFDTSAEMTKDEMIAPVAKLAAVVLNATLS